MLLSLDTKYIEKHIDILDSELREVRRLSELLEAWKRLDEMNGREQCFEIAKHQEYAIRQEKNIQCRKEILASMAEDFSLLIYQFKEEVYDANQMIRRILET